MPEFDIKKIVSELKCLRKTDPDEWIYVYCGDKRLCSLKELLKEFCSKVDVQDIK